MVCSLCLCLVYSAGDGWSELPSVGLITIGSDFGVVGASVWERDCVANAGDRWKRTH